MRADPVMPSLLSESMHAALSSVVNDLPVTLTADRRQRLMTQIGFAVEFYRIQSGGRIDRTMRAAFRRQLNDIERAGEALLQAIGKTKAELPPYIATLLESVTPETRSKGLPVTNFIKTLRKDLPKLLAAAEQGRALFETGRQPGRGGNRHQGNLALRALVNRLIALYEETTQRRAGVSTDPRTNRSGGPLVRFLQGCLKIAGVELTPEAIRGRIRRYDRSDQSILDL